MIAEIIGRAAFWSTRLTAISSVRQTSANIRIRALGGLVMFILSPCLQPTAALFVKKTLLLLLYQPKLSQLPQWLKTLKP